VGAEGLLDAEAFLTIAEDSSGFAEQLIRLYRSAEDWSAKRERGRIAFNRWFDKSRAREILGRDIGFPDRDGPD
jgi:hypothetical protein